MKTREARNAIATGKHFGQDMAPPQIASSSNRTSFCHSSRPAAKNSTGGGLSLKIEPEAIAAGGSRLLQALTPGRAIVCPLKRRPDFHRTPFFFFKLSPGVPSA